MCAVCDGATPEQFLEQQRAVIDRHGWAVIAVDRGGVAEPPFAYTAGLSRFDGHPELIVSGFGAQDSAELLNRLGADVREGWRYGAGDRLPTCACHHMKLVEVLDPGRLDVAQALYGRGSSTVPALQVVWADAQGRWPWDPAWRTRERDQECLGRRPVVPRPRRQRGRSRRA